MHTHIDEKKLVVGALVIIAISILALVIMPYVQLKPIKAPDALKPYTDLQAKGRQVYMSLGCVYCHSQQPRDPKFASADEKRGWGRASTAADYAYDDVHLLGTMRTGPDLLNIGARQPSQDWHLGHLYQPRAYMPGSIMPAYPFLFIERKGEAKLGDVVVNLPPAYKKPGITIVATTDAVNLVEYLKSLDRTYPIKKSIAESLATDKPADAAK
ncbi:MAG TPA: cbb3-type cytochrome c oxidase subunit II [Methylotenera sp.]|nr:cbb3-type cytochrome c oxidase subunit II [Methylotenera sp.]